MLLVPAWAAIALVCFEVPVRYDGLAALALATLYVLVGNAVQVGTRRLLRRPVVGHVRRNALPFLSGGLVLAAVGIGHGAGQDTAMAAGTLAAGAAFSALAFATFRGTVFLWGAAALAATAYVLAIDLAAFVPEGYRGVALAPGALVALALAALLRRRELPARGLLAALLGPRFDRPEAMATPFAAAALAATVAMPLWSLADGEILGWPLTWALAVSALVYAYLAATYRGPVWLLPALALGDLVYVRALADAGVGDSPGSTALSLVLPAIATALAGEIVWARAGRPRLLRGLPFAWSQPLHARGALLLRGGERDERDRRRHRTRRRGCLRCAARHGRAAPP